MNKHYDRYLTKKYAPLYRDRYGDMRTTAMCWGFDVGDGWFNIINTLSLLLCADWVWAKDDYNRLKELEGQREFGDWDVEYNKIVTPEMVEKARLKMLEEETKVPVAIQVKEKFGTLRFYTAGATDVHQAFIDYATILSAYTCEICGHKGKLNKGGWLSVRCKEHEDY